MEKIYSVYIITNKSNSVLYADITNNLRRRIYEHKKGIESKFTNKYKVSKCLYYYNFKNVQDAIRAEKMIKSGSREEKIKKISETNPEWKDLYKDLL
ncbi:GIY-YIG nuclease family protein [Candidatus Dependentiae bacterium]|nr:GIY-YIG nuclease family protein [Candidatus Dependentiae bacterium]